MLDLNYIRQNQNKVRWAIETKKVKVDFDRFLALDKKRHDLQVQIDTLRAERNRVAQEQNRQQGVHIKEKLQTLEVTLDPLDKEFQELYKRIPNIPSEDTPIGKGEEENRVLRRVGTLRSFSFLPKEHWVLGEELGIIDSGTASQVSGARFAYLKGDLVLLQYALTQLVLKTLTSKEELRLIAKKSGIVDVSTKPFIPVVPPVFVRPEVMDGMARLEPREERYHLPQDDMYLIGSAEHTLGPLHMQQVVPEEQLPLRYVGVAPAFRREAGSYGKDMKGILRLHQFDKLEMESFTSADESIKEQEFLVAIQEYFLQLLELPYQVVSICTGDMGAPDFRQIDIETWMPGQNRYRETNTSDLMSDYQARRLQIKTKRTSGATEFVHMNDATAFAIGRTLIAIMENYQEEDGSITIPTVLRGYTGKDRIVKNRD